MKEQWIGTAILLASALTTGVNELRLIRHVASLEEALSHVVTLAEPVSRPENDGKVVLISGAITTNPRVLSADPTASRTPYVLDPVFHIAARGVRLYRQVEMFQWVETAHTHIVSGGGGGGAADNDDRGTVDEQREKTYMYDLRWKSERIDSVTFNDRSYQNPSEDAWIFKAEEITSDPVVVGDFALSDELIDQIKRKDPIQLNAKTLQTMRIVLDQRLGAEWDRVSALKDLPLEDNYFYSMRETRPSLGDLRVSFFVKPAYPVSISGKQEKNQIVPFHAKAGESILILEDGIHTTQELYQAKLSIKYQHNRFYRLFSTTLGFLGFLVLHPLLSLRLGHSFRKAQKHLVCCIYSGGLTFSVAALTWLLYRPLWALILAASGLSPMLALEGYVRLRGSGRRLDAVKAQ